MEVVTLETPSLGDRSYLVHDGSVGLVIDPQRDIDRITALTDDLGITVSHVLETHVHNDYVSGGLALARRCGASLVQPVTGVDRHRPIEARTLIVPS